MVRPRICPSCREKIPPEAAVRYTAAGIYHEGCYSRNGGRRR